MRKVEFIKPSMEIDNEFISDKNYCKLRITPLERGYGQTIGNSMRRVLLSSLPGAAAVAIAIEGVDHEFTPVDGVIEDVTEIILNLKKVVFTINAEKDKVGELKDPRPRTVVSFLDAFYYAQSGMLEVCHEGLGNCVIYLVDSNNNVLERQEIISMNYSVEYLSVPDLPGDYTLVVDSDAMFAYGVITVY